MDMVMGKWRDLKMRNGGNSLTLQLGKLNQAYLRRGIKTKMYKCAKSNREKLEN